MLFLKSQTYLLALILAVLVTACSSHKKSSWPPERQPISGPYMDTVDTWSESWPVPQAWYNSTPLDSKIYGSWCTRGLKTVTGVGTDRCLEISGSEIQERLYSFHGANYHLNGYESDRDSLILNHPLKIKGCVLSTPHWSYTVAVCGSQLITKAVVPAGQNTWVFQKDELFERYEFEVDPFTRRAGKVRIGMFTTSGDTLFNDVIDFEVETDKYERKVLFQDNRGLLHQRNFFPLKFPKEFEACRVGLNFSMELMQVYFRQ